jgi:DNA polymerase elongation subunit (family B)
MDVVASVVELPAGARVVYDLETEHGTFTTASGIVLKNTDSVFCTFDVGVGSDDPRYMQRVFEASQSAAERVTRMFPEPMKMQFERAMMPFLLVSKKRYAYVPYLSPGAPGAVEAKGLEMVRRDMPPFARETLRAVLAALFDDDEALAMSTACRAAFRRMSETDETDECYARLRGPMARLFAAFGVRDLEAVLAETAKQVARRKAAGSFLTQFR